MVCQIRIQGHLGGQWTDWFGGLIITLEDNGDTLVTGPVVDQAALHGLLKKVRDLGMPLLSVNRVEPGQEDVADAEQVIDQDTQKGGLTLIPFPVTIEITVLSQVQFNEV